MEVFQVQYIPDQAETRPEHLFSGMATKALISSWPPVGQVTETLNGKIPFTVLLEADEGDASATWEVAIWYTLGGDSWTECPLSSATIGTTESSTNTPKLVDGRYQSYFTGSLEFTSTVTFTVKFRRTGEAAWK